MSTVGLVNATSLLTTSCLNVCEKIYQATINIHTFLYKILCKIYICLLKASKIKIGQKFDDFCCSTLFLLSIDLEYLDFSTLLLRPLV